MQIGSLIKAKKHRLTCGNIPLFAGISLDGQTGDFDYFYIYDIFQSGDLRDRRASTLYSVDNILY